LVSWRLISTNLLIFLGIVAHLLHQKIFSQLHVENLFGEDVRLETEE
jgi:hypothetical protein